MKDFPLANSSFEKEADIDLSIVIVSFNTKELLLQCLASIKNNTTGLEKEIFVVDNASVDGSPDAVSKQFSNVQLIRNQENKGLSSAGNQAFRKSQGRYLILLNSDTILLENSFLKIVKFLDENQKFSVLSPQIINESGQPYPMRLWQDTPKDALLKIIGKYNATDELKNMAGNDTREVEAVGGSCFVLRRSTIESVGLLDEKHFLYNEEDDFCRRVRKIGGGICYFPETSVKHFLGQSTHQPDIRERVIVETYKSNLYFYSKYYSTVWNIILRFLYKLTFVLSILRSLANLIKGKPAQGADDSILLKLKMFFLSPSKPTSEFVSGR